MSLIKGFTALIFIIRGFLSGMLSSFLAVGLLEACYDLFNHLSNCVLSSGLNGDKPFIYISFIITINLLHFSYYQSLN